ncbi:N-acetylglucosamine kinase [Clostridium polynesiense]|uniref:N-acetylglucosamine kinase n=1 Tax=Clostridium polynesiense TaxID=1325933 RepID=UPI0006932281|nr:BadF/BadG/BcrA/BcrD ATPase family protein [Clostridium polynesiense]
MVYDKVYDVLKEECRKQLVHGEIKGVSAAEIADKLGMVRSNVVRAFRQLIDMNMIYKVNGRPVLYYVDSSVILYELKSKDENISLSNHIDDFLTSRTKRLHYKGYYEEEIKYKLIDEVENYINNYFDVFQSKQKVDKKIKELAEVKYIIGVDGGGSATEAIAYTLEGEEITHGISGFGNIVINKEEGLKNIEIAILQCMQNLRPSNCVHIYAGLAGAYTGNNKEVIQKYLEIRFPASVTVISDADLAFNALLKGEEGILTIAGTGSISFGIHNNEYIRAGGWGNLISDRGSGYHIAINAFKQIIAEKDAGAAPSYLSREIMRALNIESISDVIDYVHTANKSSISALVPTIVKAADKNDKRAVSLLRKASRDLADLTIKVYKRMGSPDNVKIAIRGGILTKIPVIKRDFIKYLDSEITEFTIIEEDVSPAKGAYFIFCKEASQKKLKNK